MRLPEAASRPTPRRLAQAMLWLVALSGVVLSAVYTIQPDALFGLSVYPTWCWATFGLTALALSYRMRNLQSWRICLVIWVGFAGLFVEEPRRLLRALGHPSVTEPPQAGDVCVITMNCGDGGGKGVSDLAPWKPDLVLLQESPSEEVLQHWSEQLFGAAGRVLWGRDCSIIARGELLLAEGSPSSNSTMGLWRSTSGQQHLVASLRVWTPPLRLDFWSPGYWKAYRDVRQRQREQLQAITTFTEKFPSQKIVGGDFNSPAGDRLNELLGQVDLRDSFHVAGQGLGNTITNEFPFHRIDRIWVSAGWQPQQVFAIRTEYSDHRLVVCRLRNAMAN